MKCRLTKRRAAAEEAMKPFFATLMCTTLLAPAGCLSLDGTESDDDEGTLTEVALDDSEMQGRQVLSKVLDLVGGDEYISFSTNAVDGSGASVRLQLVGAASLQAIDPVTSQVVHSSGSDTLENTVLTDSQDPTRTLTITAVVPDPLLPFVTEYALVYHTSSGDDDPCKNGLAIPISGYYDESARHFTAQNRISFACKAEGVAEKCFRWGYQPGQDASKEPWRANQLCTRMAMADYCKDGTAHTLDETFVKIFDNYDGLGFDEPTWTGPMYQGVTVWPPPPDVYKFEAAWPEDDDEPVICLSKTRWQGLPVGDLDSCELPVIDPRNDAGGIFCEDLISEGLSIPGAEMVNASKYTDLLFEEWRSGTDYVSTVQGYWPGLWSGPGPRPVPVKAPYPSYTHVGTQGTLLRSLPGSITQPEIRRVYSYAKAATGRVLGRDDAPLVWPKNGYTKGTLEGMVFKAPPASGFPIVTPLYLYRNANGDYFNSIQVLAAPYVTVDTLGYLPVPE
jgi:hypothetical protein